MYGVRGTVSFPCILLHSRNIESCRKKVRKKAVRYDTISGDIKSHFDFFKMTISIINPFIFREGIEEETIS